MLLAATGHIVGRGGDVAERAADPASAVTVSANQGKAASSLLDAPLELLAGRRRGAGDGNGGGSGGGSGGSGSGGGGTGGGGAPAATMVYTTAIAAAAANATSDAVPPPPDGPSDPAVFAYPPVEQRPTVFFTAALPGIASPADFSDQMRAAFVKAIVDFVGPAPAPAPAPALATPATASPAAPPSPQPPPPPPPAPLATARILAVEPAAAGVWVPAAVEFGDRAGDGPRDLLVATLLSDANYILPSAAWGVARALNVREALPRTPVPATYAWRAGEYGDCSALCGGGWQTRSVSCESSLGGAAPPALCPQPAPPGNRSCQEQDCTSSGPRGFALVFGAWSACNAQCGAANRSRAVTCQSADGYLAQLGSCPGTAPAGERAFGGGGRGAGAVARGRGPKGGIRIVSFTFCGCRC